MTGPQQERVLSPVQLDCGAVQAATEVAPTSSPKMAKEQRKSKLGVVQVAQAALEAPVKVTTVQQQPMAGEHQKSTPNAAQVAQAAVEAATDAAAEAASMARLFIAEEHRNPESSTAQHNQGPPSPISEWCETIDEHGDLEIVAGPAGGLQRTFLVSREVLMDASPVLQQGIVQTNKTRIRMLQVDPDIFYAILCIIHKAKFRWLATHKTMASFAKACRDLRILDHEGIQDFARKNLKQLNEGKNICEVVDHVEWRMTNALFAFKDFEKDLTMMVNAYPDFHPKKRFEFTDEIKGFLEQQRRIRLQRMLDCLYRFLEKYNDRWKPMDCSSKHPSQAKELRRSQLTRQGIVFDLFRKLEIQPTTAKMSHAKHVTMTIDEFMRKIKCGTVDTVAMFTRLGNDFNDIVNGVYLETRKIYNADVVWTSEVAGEVRRWGSKALGK